MAGQIDASAWNHLSPEGRKCPTIREAIEARSESRRKYLAANRSPVRKVYTDGRQRAFKVLYAALNDVTSPERLRRTFPRLVPRYPYCTDRFPGPVFVRSAEVALQCRHIQLNGPGVQVWMLFDVDRKDAAAAWGDTAAPNFIATNADNGHAHLAYLLKVPILKYARPGPLAFAADVERGLQRLLDADPNYCGMLTKNPVHEDWRVTWVAAKPYLLGDLAKALGPREMSVRKRCPNLGTGLSRNVTVFDETRRWSYGEILPFKRHGGSSDVWTAQCIKYAHDCNEQLPKPLVVSEVRSIAKSVSRWTWRHFDEAKFSDVQSARSRRRWKGHTPEPWKACGVSRATYYRRKMAGLL